jgi:hypothetical protein
MHIGHLTKFEMINITFKCHNEIICKKTYNFHNYPTWVLVFSNVFMPLCMHVTMWVSEKGEVK